MYIAATSLQSCPTLCDPIDGSPSGSPIPEILQARTLEWVAISFSNIYSWVIFYCVYAPQLSYTFFSRWTSRLLPYPSYRKQRCNEHWGTCVPHPETPSHIPPYAIPQGGPSGLALSALFHASNLNWWSISHMAIYMFQCYSLKSSHPWLLPQSPKVCSLYLCLFCCLEYRVILTIFLNSIYMR